MSHPVLDQVDDAVITDEAGDLDAAKRVLANPRFMALFLSQILTQVGGNMVLFGLTIKVFDLTNATTSVSLLLLAYLVPAVVFGAVAGVFVDRYDRRLILIATNLARGLLYLPLVLLDDQLVLIYAVVVVVATLTTFFAPAESAMIPLVVPRSQLLTANGLFIFGLQASFALGFAVLGPLVNSIMGTEALIAIVAVLYVIAGVILVILPAAPPAARDILTGRAVDQAKLAIRATGEQLREGLVYIRDHNNIFWSLTYLTITSSLIGVLGTLGPAFVRDVLGLGSDDIVIIVMPLGAGLVVGILLLNAYGKYFTRRRLIEGGLAVLAVSLVILGLAQRVETLAKGEGVVSLLTVVITVAFIAGITYAFVAVPAQTALQEELPGDVRGRVFGVLNTLVSLASFLPIIIVGPVADLVGTPVVILVSAGVIAATAVGSYFLAGPTTGMGISGHLEIADPVTVTATSSTLTRPTRLRYIEDEVAGPGAIDYAASPVLPGVAGPAGAVAALDVIASPVAPGAPAPADAAALVAPPTAGSTDGAALEVAAAIAPAPVRRRAARCAPAPAKPQAAGPGPAPAEPQAAGPGPAPAQPRPATPAATPTTGDASPAAPRARRRRPPVTPG
jgi:MFS family permease